MLIYSRAVKESSDPRGVGATKVLRPVGFVRSRKVLSVSEVERRCAINLIPAVVLLASTVIGPCSDEERSITLPKGKISFQIPREWKSHDNGKKLTSPDGRVTIHFRAIDAGVPPEKFRDFVLKALRGAHTVPEVRIVDLGAFSAGKRSPVGLAFRLLRYEKEKLASDELHWQVFLGSKAMVYRVEIVVQRPSPAETDDRWKADLRKRVGAFVRSLRLE